MKERKHEGMKTIASGIGSRVMEFRKLANLNQAEFSQKLEATQASISQIEAGKCLPSGNFIVKLLEVFPTVNLHWLFMGIENPHRVNVASNEEAKLEPVVIHKLYEINERIRDFHKDVSNQIRDLTEANPLQF